MIQAIEKGPSAPFRLRSTQELRNLFPNQVLFTFHPQRWTDGGFPWFKELILQWGKNQVKRFLVK